MSNQEIEELKSRISDLELGLQTVEDDLEVKSEEAEALRRDVYNKTKQMKMMEEELQRCKKDNDIQEQLIDLKREEVTSMKSKLLQAYKYLMPEENTAIEYSEMVQRITNAYIRQREEAAKEREKASSNSVVEVEEKRRLQDALTEAKQKESEKEAEIINQKKEIQRLTAENQKMHQENQERESEMESLSMVIEENDAELDRLNGMIAELNASLKSKDEEVSGLSATVESNDAELDRLNGMIAELNASLKSKDEALKSKDEEVSGLSATVESNDAELDRLNGMIAELNASLKSKDDALQTQANATDTLTRECNAVISEVYSLYSDVEMLTADYSSLKSSYSFVSSHYKEVSTNYDALLRLVSSLKESISAELYDSILDSYAGVVNELALRVGDYEAELSYWIRVYNLKRFDELTKNEKKQKEENLVLQLRLNELKEVKSQNEELKSELESCNQQKKVVEEELSVLKKEVTATHKKEKKVKKNVCDLVLRDVYGKGLCECSGDGKKCMMCQVKEMIVGLKQSNQVLQEENQKMKYFAAVSLVSFAVSLGLYLMKHCSVCCQQAHTSLQLLQSLLHDGRLKHREAVLRIHRVVNHQLVELIAVGALIPVQHLQRIGVLRLLLQLPYGVLQLPFTTLARGIDDHSVVGEEQEKRVFPTLHTPPTAYTASSDRRDRLRRGM